jgi:predicted Rossmann-fold nucleotide-binding protein
MGTLDELCEILTWAQLGLHSKPVGLLDVRDYWRGFLAFLDTAVAEGFLHAPDRARLHHHTDVEALVEILLAAALEPA